MSGFLWSFVLILGGFFWDWLLCGFVCLGLFFVNCFLVLFCFLKAER